MREIFGIIIATSFTGSVVVILFGLCSLIPNPLNAAWHFLARKLSLIFYLIPFTALVNQIKNSGIFERHSSNNADTISILLKEFVSISRTLTK